MSKTRDTWREPEAPVCPSRLSHAPPAMSEATLLEKWCNSASRMQIRPGSRSCSAHFSKIPPCFLQPSLALCGTGLFLSHRTGEGWYSGWWVRVCGFPRHLRRVSSVPLCRFVVCFLDFPEQVLWFISPPEFLVVWDLKILLNPILIRHSILPNRDKVGSDILLGR